MFKKYLLIIDHLASSIFPAVEKLKKEYAEYASIELLLITSESNKQTDREYAEQLAEILTCDFLSQETIIQALSKYKNQIVGVICRGDKQIQYLRRVIPHLPKEILVADLNALEVSTNKKMMRTAFTHLYPEITPQFVEVNNASASSISTIVNKLKFPVIIKPAQLASSLLIQSCFNVQELTIALQDTFTKINEIYLQEERLEMPQVIVEEYLEGDFYSIDTYTDAIGNNYFCPLVAYIPAKQLGIDDFFLYKRFLPTKLNEEQIKDGQLAASKAIQAVGLRNSTAHIEMILTDNGWKIIELGPRIGRFRQNMYFYGYDIDHSYNDIKIHLGFPPAIPNILKKYVAAYSIYPDRSGRLVKLHGWNELITLSQLVMYKLFAKPQQFCYQAKKGGHALAEFIIACTNKEEYKQLVKWIEKEVYAEIEE